MTRVGEDNEVWKWCFWEAAKISFTFRIIFWLLCIWRFFSLSEHFRFIYDARVLSSDRFSVGGTDAGNEVTSQRAKFHNRMSQPLLRAIRRGIFPLERWDSKNTHSGNVNVAVEGSLKRKTHLWLAIQTNDSQGFCFGKAKGQKRKSRISIFKSLFIILDSKYLLKRHIDPCVYNLQMILALSLKKNAFFYLLHVYTVPFFYLYFTTTFYF